MELRNLTTFLRVAELKSFTQAANDLGYAQSTVTFHIQQLEEELGVKLFDRVGNKISLTMAGEYLLPYVYQILHLELEIKQFYKVPVDLTGRLRIGVVESILSTYVVKAIPIFREKYPNISLEITSASSLELMELLESNDVDLIIAMGKKFAHSNLVRDFIKTIKVSFVTSSYNPLLKKEIISFQDIAQQPLILPEKISLYRQIAEEVAAQFDCILEPDIQVDNTAFIIKLLKEGMGVSCLPEYLIDKEISRGELAILPIEKDDFLKVYIQFLHHKNKWVTSPMKCFTNIMKEILS